MSPKFRKCDRAILKFDTAKPLIRIWTDAEADLNRRWKHTSFCEFVVLRLKL